jgi:hypothetical protein
MVACEGLQEVDVEPYADGRSWGEHGPYEWTSAVAQIAVDPDHKANAGITDLTLADRGADGLVRAEADVRILAPVSGGNGKLLVVVPNRGFLGGLPFAAGAPFEQFVSPRPHPGDGLLLERGWTIAWCGWQWDVLRSPGTLGLNVPDAPCVPQPMRIEFRPDELQESHSLSDSALFFQFADYPAADVNDTDAALYIRTAPDAEPEQLPRDAWRFKDAVTVTVDGGFQPFHWYTLIYRSSRNPLTGMGLLAVRDVTAQLRRENEFPTALAFGVSQSGRFLRQFLYEARNLDETGALVFDGVFAHIASARRGEFNHRYAQPSLTHPIGFSNLPPYDTTALLEPQRTTGGVPKLFFTNTSWEYWRGDGALVHVDPESGEDLPDDRDARTYLLTGADHLGGTPFKAMMPTANPVHLLDTQPLLRALFVALDAWVSEGTPPPDSAIPRRADGTLLDREQVLQQFSDAAELRGFSVPDPASLPVTREVDLGDEADKGIGRWPLKLGQAKPALVPAIDADGNETSGVALPGITESVAAYTGWNPRRPVPGLPDVLYEFAGSRLPLLSGRPIPGRAEYEQAVRKAAATLVNRRLLLAFDIEQTVTEALTIYDEVAGGR